MRPNQFYGIELPPTETDHLPERLVSLTGFIEELTEISHWSLLEVEMIGHSQRCDFHVPEFELHVMERETGLVYSIQQFRAFCEKVAAIHTVMLLGLRGDCLNLSSRDQLLKAGEVLVARTDAGDWEIWLKDPKLKPFVLERFPLSGPLDDELWPLLHSI